MAAIQPCSWACASWRDLTRVRGFYTLEGVCVCVLSDWSGSPPSLPCVCVVWFSPCLLTGLWLYILCVSQSDELLSDSHLAYKSQWAPPTLLSQINSLSWMVVQHDVQMKMSCNNNKHYLQQINSIFIHWTLSLSISESESAPYM